GAGIFCAGMQSLKYLKDPLNMLGINANAIISDDKDPSCSVTPSRKVNLRRRRAPELKGIPNKILQHLPKANRIAIYCGQGVVGDLRAALRDGQAEIVQCTGQQILAINHSHVPLLAIYTRVGQQVSDQLLHTLGAIDSESDIFVSGCVYLPL